MHCGAAILVVTLALTQAFGTPADASVSVMIVGDFHMANPGRDLHNMQVDDVLAPKRQAEIKAATEALNRFRPTIVAAEWPADIAASRFDSYLKGTLAPSRNEVVQLAFRLAATAELPTVHGVDAGGDFPYDAVEAYAQSHGESAILDAQNTALQDLVDRTGAMLAHGTVGGTLRFINDPERIAGDNAFYRTTLKIGGGVTQPVADLLASWYRRNFLICANLVQLAKPGDRVVVFYGFGHALLLRQCIQEMPGFKLVEPNSYLPE